MALETLIPVFLWALIVALVGLAVILAVQLRRARKSAKETRSALHPPEPDIGPEPVLTPAPTDAPAFIQPERSTPVAAPAFPTPPGGDAYAAGLADLQSGEGFGGGASGMAWLLPMALRRARGGALADPASWPTFDTLTHGEQRGIALLDGLRDAEGGEALAVADIDYRIGAELEDLTSAFQRLRDVRFEWQGLDRLLAEAGRDLGDTPLALATTVLRHVAFIVDGIIDRRGTPPSMEEAEPIALGAPDMLDRLGERPDPDLWHDLVLTLDADSEYAPDLLTWIVRQPECDRGTAAALFAMLDGPSVLSLPREQVEGDPYGKILAAICDRTAGDGFMTARLGVEAAPIPIDQRALAADLAARAPIEGTLPVPMGLYSPPVEGGSARSMWYALDEGAVVRAQF
ncbi:MAG: hypothetical protein ACU0DW_03550 [Shimia sp.]